MEYDLFADAARQLLQGECTPARVRAIEDGSSPRALWQSLEQAGFADALVPEHAGGAGLALAQLFDVWSLAGAHALPVPLGETMLARALLAGAGAERPPGAIALAQGLLQAPLTALGQVNVGGAQGLLPSTQLPHDAAAVTLGIQLDIVHLPTPFTQGLGKMPHGAEEQDNACFMNPHHGRFRG